MAKIGRNGKVGRPYVNINWDYLAKLFEAGSTVRGAAAAIGVEPNTLTRRCRRDLKRDLDEFRQTCRAKGDDQLRVKQFQLAMQGNTTMLIWLGKQRLNQAEKQQNQFIDADGNVYNPAPVIKIEFTQSDDGR